MQSDGGLTTWDNFSGLRAILSGPAGGVIGFSRTCYDEEEKMPLVAVDMGGTSTDVSRFDGELDQCVGTLLSTNYANIFFQTALLRVLLLKSSSPPRSSTSTPLQPAVARVCSGETTCSWLAQSQPQRTLVQLATARAGP